MTHTLSIACPGRSLRLLLVLLVCAFPVSAQAQQENRLRRIEIIPHQGFTRVNLFFQAPPDYTLRSAPGRIRLDVRGADSPAFKKFRAYADPQLSGLITSARAGTLSVSISVRDAEPGVQAISYGNPSVLSLDIGPAVRRARLVDIVPGREPILSGTERFVRDFAHLEPAGIPFAPTDAKLLQELLPEQEMRLFQYGEGLLYEEKGSEAVEIFSSMLAKPPAVRALAYYRLGGALCLLGRNEEALAAFSQAEALWPAYLEQAPEISQSYAEVRAKSGDFAGGRALLVRLMAKFAGTPYQAQLLNRLADMSERHGEKETAAAMYRSVVIHAPASAAAGRARLKLADRELLTLSRDRYRELLGRYQAIYLAPGDFALRDEALFKMALLLALYAPSREALEASVSYDKRYPRGIFSTIVKKMREELLFSVYRELHAAGSDTELARLALVNKEYLARCLSDPEFVPRLSRAFGRGGMLTQEMQLFDYLDGKNWAAGSAPFMLSRVVDDAVILGNMARAESAGREFLARFPADARAGRVREQLGRVGFERGDLGMVSRELRFLMAKGGKPQLPESDYYLGKALEGGGDHLGAARSLARFTAGAKEGSALLLDGYFALAGALAALKDYPGALAACRSGAKLASGEAAGQFLYKMGELQLQQGMVRQATASWEQAAAGGGTWGKLASEAINDLNWRMKISRELP